MNDVPTCEFIPQLCGERHLAIDARLGIIEHTLHKNGLCAAVKVIESKVEDLPELRKYMLKLVGGIAVAQAALVIAIALLK